MGGRGTSRGRGWRGGDGVIETMANEKSGDGYAGEGRQ